ncbi:HNH endonuclease [Candidatus Saccharibacteria bacterium]|nr:HNH endonuclease [Candidatus Saccharibacteria bacterium]
MKSVALTQGAVALVDDDDFARVSLHSWSLHSKGYAAAKINKIVVKLHRFVMNAPVGKPIDHINQNKLDNRKSNLRYCTPEQNSANIDYPQKNNKCGARGVSLKKGRYVAQIRLDGKPVHLGYFNDIESASKAYKDAKRQKEKQLWQK